LKKKRSKGASQEPYQEPSSTGYIESDSIREKVYKLTQDQILELVDENTRKKRFDISLTQFGPYSVDIARNGRTMVFSGRKGHIATLDMLRMNMGCEESVGDSIYDVKFLHNHSMFATAQVISTTSCVLHSFHNIERVHVYIRP